MKSSLNKGNKIKAISVNLTKAFGTMDHSLLIAKLEAYGFDSFIIYAKLPNKQTYLTNIDVRSETVLVYGEKLHQVSLKVP